MPKSQLSRYGCPGPESPGFESRPNMNGKLCCDLTVLPSPGTMDNKGNYLQMALIQVSELLYPDGCLLFFHGDFPLYLLTSHCITCHHILLATKTLQ